MSASYADQLLPIPAAAKKYKMSTRTFLRFRRRHGLPTLPGRNVHEQDVINALQRERGISQTTTTQ